MQTPLIHLNGSSAERLSQRYREAVEAVVDALDKLCTAAPHPRDYYPLGDDAYIRARGEHEARAEKLRGIRDELVALYEAVQEQAQR